MDMLTAPYIPQWLEALLSEKFYNACIFHEEAHKNEKNIFCLDCCESICPHCLSPHASHRLLQIRRYVYHDVVKLCDAEKFMDCAFVQAYVSNAAKVVFLNERPLTNKPCRGSIYNCSTCDRSLEHSYLYCSLSCKLQYLLKTEGDVSKYITSHEQITLPELGPDDGQMTSDSILEQTAESASAESSGASLREFACTATTQILTAPHIPQWLEALLSEKFYNACIFHEEACKNEKNIFCLDCCESICPHCLSPHASHRLLQIRSYVHHDVVKLCDAEKFMDCAFVQAYVSNAAKVVFLNERPLTNKPCRGSIYNCSTCDRSLEHSYLYCSLSCKLQYLLKTEGDVSKYITSHEQITLPELGPDDGQMTSDSVLEQTAESASAESSGASLREFACTATTQILTAPHIPQWLEALLSEKFYNACIFHEEARKNEKNIFCLYCCESICPHCLSPHASHRLLQIRSYVHHDVVKLCDAEKFMDCAFVQAYVSNAAKVVFLNERPPTNKSCRGSIYNCSTCDRSLEHSYLYCSLSCKLQYLLKTEGDVSKYITNHEQITLPELGPDDGQMTSDSVLEQTTESASAENVVAPMNYNIEIGKLFFSDDDIKINVKESGKLYYINGESDVQYQNVRHGLVYDTSSMEGVRTATFLIFEKESEVSRMRKQLDYFSKAAPAFMPRTYFVSRLKVNDDTKFPCLILTEQIPTMTFKKWIESASPEDSLNFFRSLFSAVGMFHQHKIFFGNVENGIRILDNTPVFVFPAVFEESKLDWGIRNDLRELYVMMLQMPPRINDHNFDLFSKLCHKYVWCDDYEGQTLRDASYMITHSTVVWTLSDMYYFFRKISEYKEMNKAVYNKYTRDLENNPAINVDFWTRLKKDKRGKRLTATAERLKEIYGRGGKYVYSKTAGIMEFVRTTYEHKPDEMGKQGCPGSDNLEIGKLLIDFFPEANAGLYEMMINRLYHHKDWAAAMNYEKYTLPPILEFLQSEPDNFDF